MGSGSQVGSGAAPAASELRGKVAGFGFAAVFWTTLSTILGAILFLRMGYAVGHLGLIGAIAVILLGHLVTIPAALAVAEIATNQKVAGGGVYYVLSRSFGMTVGGSIGIALFFSQAISLAFYIIAFAEAFRPLLEQIGRIYPFVPTDSRVVTVPALGLLWLALRLFGARLGLSALYVVAGTLLASLALFFAEVTVRSCRTSIMPSPTSSRPTPSSWCSQSAFPPSPGSRRASGCRATCAIRSGRFRSER